MKVVQSYLSTIIKKDFSIVEMRILFHVVRRCRILTYGKRLDDYVRKEIDTSRLNLDFSIKTKELMGSSHNYVALYKALAHLQDATKVEWFNKDTKTWCRSYWVNNIEYTPGKGILRFSSPRWLVDYICDFKKFGYREYDFELAMSLSNPNAARLYLMTCSITKNWVINIAQLKEILGINGYKNFSSFERRVLLPSMKELEKRGMNGFVYKVNRIGDSKFSSPVSLTIIPVKREKSSTDTSTRLAIKDNIPAELTAYLLNNVGFSDKEIGSNYNTLSKFSGIPGWADKLVAIVERYRRKSRTKGYIVAAMKDEILCFEADKGTKDIK